MPTKLRIKTEFVSAVLRETATIIQEKQEQTAKEWNLFDTGRLENSLKHHFSIQNQDGGAKLTMRYLPYLRLLDMRDPRRKVKREGYHLYNRIVFGVLYNPTFNMLQNGLTEDIKAAIGDKLNEIYAQDMPFYKITNEALGAVAEQDRNLAAILSKSMRMGYR